MNIEKQIEKMVNRWFDIANFRILSAEDRKAVIEELSTLIQQEREEAIEGFAEWARKECCDNTDIVESVDEYLATSSKEEQVVEEAYNRGTKEDTRSFKV